MKRWLFLISLGVAGGLILRFIAFEGIYVASPSMEPTLPVEMHFMVDKVSFLFRSPRRGEIVTLASPVGEDKELIKRVIGLPGETIGMKDKIVTINGEALFEPYAIHKRKNEVLVGDNISEMKIPENSYFVLGDNRDESKDSTTWKDPVTEEPIYFVHESNIKGRLMNVLE